MNSIKNTSILFTFFDFSQSPLTNLLPIAPNIWQLRSLYFEKTNLLNNFSSDLFPHVFFDEKDSICIGKGTKILPGACIEGPCFIGNNVHIGHNAYIRRGSILCDDVKIGHCSEIARTIMLQGAKAPHFNYIGDSIIGKEVNLGAHATCANLRLDEKDVTIRCFKEKFYTKQRKVGAFIGDYSFIGCGSIINPGTLIQKRSKIPPLSVINGFI